MRFEATVEVVTRVHVEFEVDEHEAPVQAALRAARESNGRGYTPAIYRLAEISKADG